MRILPLLLALGFLSFAGTIHGASENWRMETIDAPSLAGNVLGDAPRVDIGVHLPASYAEGARRYPVVYFLSGYTSGGPEYLGYFGGFLDRMEREGRVNDCIVVVVCGVNRLGGAFYVNSEGTGDWETFVTQTLVAHVDGHYRTLTKRESRAMTGLSMGGYGASNLAMRHPELYNVCYAMSPGAYDENGLAESQMFKNGGTTREIFALLKRLEALPAEEARQAYFAYVAACKDEDILFTLAYSTTFSPAPGKAPYFHYPYRVDAEGHVVRDADVWKKYESGFGQVKERVQRYADNIRKYASFTINCGYNDEYAWIVAGTTCLDRALTEARLPHGMVWHDGAHVSRMEPELAYGLLPTVTAALVRE